MQVCAHESHLKVTRVEQLGEGENSQHWSKLSLQLASLFSSVKI